MAESGDVSKGAQEEEVSEEEEEDPEPKLKYERIANDMPQILRNDAASCIAVHSKFLALGTHWGVIHILDHQGNNIRSKELLLHTTTINQISIDENGDHIASCSDDGKVVIHGLYSAENNQLLTFDRPVRAVALDPNFHRSGTGRRFITGNDKVLLYEKTFLSRYKSTVLHQGEGPIRNISWKARFTAWASDLTIIVYDMMVLQVISKIKRDHNPLLRPELYRCNFFWKDEKTLLIGWADSVKTGVIKEKGPNDPVRTDPSFKDLPSLYVEIINMFTADFFVCGLAPFDNNIVALTTLKEDEQGTPHSRPQFKVLEFHQKDSSYSEIFSDSLSVRGFTEYRCSDYFLESLPGEGMFFIVSPKDVIVAKPRDEDDHIAWLLDNDKYEEALKAAKEGKKLKRHSISNVGRKYLDHLMQIQKYDKAAEICSTIFENDCQLWEEIVYKFAKLKMLRILAPVIPRGENKLDATVYEMVLNEYIQGDQEGFLNLINQWEKDLYSIPTIINAVRDKLSYEPTNLYLLQALGKLYSYEGRYEKALAIYLSIKAAKEVFDLVYDYHLYSAIQDKLETLMELDPTEATKLLVQSTEKVPVSLVVDKLKKQPNLLYLYLHGLFTKDPDLGEEYHGLLTELYAEFDPDKLLPFLRSSNNYPLEQALAVCQQRERIPEVVFLLGRMGNTKQALQQITEKLHDINQAIDFCKEHDDKELWEDLIKYSLDKPEFITTLLQNIGTHVDPIMLIKEIPTGKKIPELKKSLVKILHDYNIQISLREGCKKILVSDCCSLLERLLKQQKRGVSISDDQVCLLCNGKLLVKDPRHGEDIVVFYCKHAFHSLCLNNNLTCSICSAQKSSRTAGFST